MCSLCGEYDDTNHWIFACNAFKNFKTSVKWIKWKDIDFIQFMCNRSHSNSFISKIACLLWMARNNAIFRNASINYVGIIKSSEYMYNQQINTILIKQPRMNNSVVNQCIKWTPSNVTTYKMNTYGSVSK